MKILKFGGSSVKDASMIKSVIKIIAEEHSKEKVRAVVFSAFRGVTDELIRISRMAAEKQPEYDRELKKLLKRHVETAKQLSVDAGSESFAKILHPLFNELEEILRGVFLIKELSAKTQDYILSFGERLSCTAINAAMNAAGIKSSYLDSRGIIKTDRNFGNAHVLFEETNNLIAGYFSKHDELQIAAGFIASTLNDETTTLGRGGSDYTASILGAALEADSVEIWTDVDGVLTADPGKVKEAFTLDNMSYEEAMELSHFGAKVIYPPTIQPAAMKKIPVVIRNTFNPPHRGTVISSESRSTYIIKGISSIDEISLVRIQGSGMVGISGTAQRVFYALAQKNINVILISQASSEYSICLAIMPGRSSDAREALEHEFRYELKMNLINEISVDNNYSIIAVVGERMRSTPGIAGKFFSALGDGEINISAIAQGSSELNISAVISKKDEVNALNLIHQKFFPARQEGNETKLNK